jgi:hypothetical protein
MRNREHYETYEKMQWVCFHYEFEHSSSDATQRAATALPGTAQRPRRTAYVAQQVAPNCLRLCPTGQVGRSMRSHTRIRED